MFRNLKLQNRILFLVTAVTVCLMALIVTFDSYSLQKSVQETYVSQLDGMTTAINGRYEESHNYQDVQQIFDYIQYKNGNVLELTLYGSEGVLVSTDRSRIGKPVPMDLLTELQPDRAPETHFQNVPGTSEDRLTAPLMEDGVMIGIIEMVLNTAESDELIRHRTLLMIGVGVGITALLLIVLNLIIRRFLILPLLQVREAALTVKHGKPYKEIRMDSSQEFNELAGAVNEMVRNLEGRYQELQMAQKQLVESEKMGALGSLVAGVSHEINTPIGIGVTAASFMAEKSKDFRRLYEQNAMKRSDLEEYLKTVGETTGMIQANLQRASELVRSFKQVAVDRSVETKRNFLVKEYVQDVLTSLQPKLKKTKHRVEVTGMDGLEIVSDPGAVSQIVTNLIMNSLIHAFGPDDEGTIAIAVEADAAGRWLTIRYADNGRGMTPEVSAHIFEPFFTTNRGGGGTGLGMHIVYNLATQSLGGSIRCDSAPGRGTTFTIQIPMNEG